jgi:hypothetical protein
VLGFGGTTLDCQLCMATTCVDQLTVVDGARLFPSLTNPLAARQGLDIQ